MRAFTPTAQGVACRMEDWERELLARLALEVASMLDAAGGPVPEPAGGANSVNSADSADSAEPLDPRHPGDPGDGTDAVADADAAAAGAQGPVRAGESGRDREILQALDFEAPSWGPEDQIPHDPLEGAPAEVLPALRVLLPEASEDPVTAMEVSSLTRERLRGVKHGRLGAMAAELRAPTGAGGEVLVARGGEADWLGAMNDIRLVLAQRLSIDSAQDAERVHALAFSPQASDETAHAQWLRATAAIYDLMTWWQESLVTAVLGSSGPA